MRPLTDACVVSREKLAFIVDATAGEFSFKCILSELFVFTSTRRDSNKSTLIDTTAPIASIVPISSWVGFEISLIQAELNRILEQGKLIGSSISYYSSLLSDNTWSTSDPRKTLTLRLEI